jgi:hypothetical protein
MRPDQEQDAADLFSVRKLADKLGQKHAAGRDIHSRRLLDASRQEGVRSTCQAAA